MLSILYKKIWRGFIIFVIASLGFIPGLVLEAAANRSEVLNLSDQILEKKEKLKQMEEDLKTYEKKIDEARAQSITLKNQIELINNQIKKRELEIEETTTKIEQIQLEILETKEEINNTNAKIEMQKGLVAYYLRELDKLRRKSPLEIILLHPSFSKFFDELRGAERLQDGLNNSILKLKELNNNLAVKQNELKTKKESNIKFKNDLEQKRARLEAQKTVKTFLIGQSFASESKFQALLYEAKKEQEELDNEINRLESEIREKLKQNDLFPYGASVVLTWPIPKNDITASFRDPDYPYRYLFEHSGIDIRAPHGTPIRAPAPGYVLKVKDSNNWQNYSYIVLVHAGGISTVYIHLSQVLVKPDTYVSRGQVMGLTGGTPKTRGAGLLTTGPHLHFETRFNGVPVNPLEYLVDI